MRQKEMTSQVLIVDDEKSYCNALGNVLEAAGFEVQSAYDAQAATEVLEQYTPDLVLLDVMMPKVDGITFLRRLRTNPAWSETAVIVISAKCQPEDKSTALAAGADRFLAKPFSVDDLRNTIHELMSARSPAAQLL